MKQVTKIEGKKKGYTSVILVGVHGNEKCGVEALEEIISKIKIDKGIIYFIKGNPLAIKNNQRFVDENLNRLFKKSNKLNEKVSYEYRRALFLMKYLKKSSALLDVHSSSNPKSKPFIICEKNGFKLAKNLPAKTIISGFDKIQPGGTDYFMNKNGKIGICLECGYTNNLSSKKVAEKGIFNFLISRGHIIKKKTITPQKQSFRRIYYMKMSKTNKFKLSKKFDDFEKISKNQLIGWDGKEKIKSPQQGFILFPKNSNKKGEEVFILGK